MKHQRSLQQKRMSKEKAKAKSPPIADDSASNVSVDSHVSIPVIMLPIDAQSVDIDDNVVEFQQPQPEAPSPPPPPPPSIVFDAETLASVFQRLNTFLSKFEGSSTPQLGDVGSARRSLTAGPSDEARPNPLTQVSDTAPQGPDAAPGPSKAEFPSCPGS